MKLPRTLHIEGSRLPAGTTDPEAVEFNKLNGQFLVIEEKVDGTGVSISLDTHFNLKINHRGSPATGKEFKPLHEWAEKHWEDLVYLLGERYTLFGEWMYNKHTIYYDKLPHLFLESDIYDNTRKIWLSTSARNNLLNGCRFIKQVPVLAALKPSALWQITSLVGKTKFQSPEWQDKLRAKCKLFGADFETVLQQTDKSGMMEGLYIKQEDDLQVLGRYKFIRYEFLDTILTSGSHVRDRLPIYNSLSGEQYNYQVGE
jgi:hypothetical protein